MFGTHSTYPAGATRFTECLDQRPGRDILARSEPSAIAEPSVFGYGGSHERGALPEHGMHRDGELTGHRNGMSYRYLADVMLRERKRLGLGAYDLHALRYRGVQELAWHGCHDDEIAAYSGHKTKAMIEKYPSEARQIMRARQARAKRQ